MATKRYVKRNASGGWDILKEGHRRSAVQAQSKTKAVAHARDLVRREGGGEVRVVNEMGKITDSTKVTGRSGKTADPRPGSGSALPAARQQ